AFPALPAPAGLSWPSPPEWGTAPPQRPRSQFSSCSPLPAPRRLCVSSVRLQQDGGFRARPQAIFPSAYRSTTSLTLPARTEPSSGPAGTVPLRSGCRSF
ncbi:DUF6809 domain-containing protein, partial [Dysosmobacter welbionis]